MQWLDEFVAHAPSPIRNNSDVRAAEAEGLPPLPVSTWDLLREAAARYGDAPALSFFLEAARHGDLETLTYRGLFEGVTRAANLFAALGVGRDDVVALILPNLPETHLCLWGAQAAGVALPINPLLEPAAIADLLRASRAKVVVSVGPFPGTDLFDKAIAAIAAAPAVESLVIVDLAGHVGGWKRWPAALGAWKANRRAPTVREGVSVVRFGQSTGALPGDRLLGGREFQPSDTAALFATGGTTGAPKLARHTHGNEVAAAWMSLTMLGEAYRPGHVAFCGLPVFHVNGAIVTGLAAFLCGVHVILGTPQGYRAPGLIPRFWEIVARHRINSFSGVPTLMAALLQQPTAGHDISSLSIALCGAAPLSAELMTRFEQATGVTLLEGYGLTEATCACSINPRLGERKVGSVGIALPFQKLRIAVKGEGGWRWASDGETGQVLAAGPNTFPGYVEPSQNRGFFPDMGDGERWLDTGDLGVVDADGYLWLKGRSKDLIIRGGHNLDPAMIEDAFYSHPAVALAAAIGRPDAHAGEVPVVYVQLKDGAAATPGELAAHAEAHIHERAARPKDVVIVDALPLTAVGKVFKPALREMDRE